MQVVSPLRDGLYDDFDLIEGLWDHALRCSPICHHATHGSTLVPVPARHRSQRLLLLLQSCPYARRDRLRANPSEHPLMLAEPTLNTRELREKTVELAFEKLAPPAICSWHGTRC